MGALNSQLMVVTWKAESESKETQERVKIRPMVTTEPAERMAELRHQIAMLMGALTETRQGNGHTSTQISPWECGHGCGCSGGGNHSCLDSHNNRGGPGQMTWACSLLTEHGMEGTGSQGSEQGN